MSGLDEKRFGPEKYMTRGMLVTVLSRLAQAEIEADNVELPFTDVNASRYYYEPVVWAYQHGIVNGLDAVTFAPEQYITREQFCVMFARYAAYVDVALEAVRESASFSDEAKISTWARESVDALQRAAIISGMGDGTFAPLGKATRAQAATILTRFCRSYVETANTTAN